MSAYKLCSSWLISHLLVCAVGDITTKTRSNSCAYVKPCPHYRIKVRLSQKRATVDSRDVHETF